MKTKKTRYGLSMDGIILCFHFQSDDNGGTMCCLNNDDSGPIWMTDSLKNAEYVKENNTGWYNAGHSTPMHHPSKNVNYKDRLEIVKFEIEIESVVP